VAPAATPLAAANTDNGEDADAATSTLLLPDGSRVPALNGARSPWAMSEVWPNGVPWSPITGVEHSPAGIDWCVPPTAAVRPRRWSGAPISVEWTR